VDDATAKVFFERCARKTARVRLCVRFRWALRLIADGMRVEFDAFPKFQTLLAKL
jgi:hypothetical protein